jgi:hypothetical protein
MSNRETTSSAGSTVIGTLEDAIEVIRALLYRVERLEARPNWPLDLRPLQNPDGSFAVTRPSTGGTQTITGPL